MKDIGKELIDFIDKTPNCYFCVTNLANKLEEEGYERLFESENWNSDNLLKGHKYYVTRNDSSIIAFKIPEEVKEGVGFNIVSTHADSPSFAVKTDPVMQDNNYIKLNTRSYGSMINYSWLDRPLSMAGRVVIKQKDGYRSVEINFDYDLMVIPSQAIHINREVNKGVELNHQVDMLPIISLENFNLNDEIKAEVESRGYSCESVCDYDLFLYNRDKAKYVGLREEFILAPRLDDLACVVPAFHSFLDSNNSNSIGIFCSFNNEEIGSMTKEGADSTFLFDVLNRISNCVGLDIYSSLANSFVVSADNAHATHPNAASKSDPTNKVFMNDGIVIKHHTNYTTDAVSSSLFKEICYREGVYYQDFECRSDMRCGATLGGVSQRHVAVDSIDVGIGQLAMHSANELIGSKDVIYMYQVLAGFYNTSFRKEKGMVKVLSNNQDKR